MRIATIVVVIPEVSDVPAGTKMLAMTAGDRVTGLYAIEWLNDPDDMLFATHTLAALNCEIDEPAQLKYGMITHIWVGKEFKRV